MFSPQFIRADHKTTEFTFYSSQSERNATHVRSYNNVNLYRSMSAEEAQYHSIPVPQNATKILSLHICLSLVSCAWQAS